jgi:release factor glutamine methyltransferase
MTIGEVLKFSEDQLKRAGIAEAALDAKYLLMEVASLSSTALFFSAREELGEEIITAYRMALERRTAREPLQYIMGTQEFMGLSFLVSPAVLIPRQDTELLVEAAIPFCHGARVLDLCTGSGCILLSLAKLGGIREAVGTDLSREALAVAQLNADRLNLRAQFIQSDLWETVPGNFDVIISNPPYIPTEEIGGLMPEVRDFEPHMALDGGADGLYFYRKIAAGAGARLHLGGRIFLEIGYHQAEDVVRLLEENGFREIIIKKDYAGLDRVVCARWMGKLAFID